MKPVDIETVAYQTAATFIVFLCVSAFFVAIYAIHESIQEHQQDLNKENIECPEVPEDL